MDDLISKLIGLSCCYPDEPEVVKDYADVHATGELNDAWAVPAEGQVGGEVNWHGGTVVGDQHAAVSFNPGKDVRVWRAPGRHNTIANDIHTHGGFHSRQLHLDERRDMLVEQEAD